jgi:hypothetical protein
MWAVRADLSLSQAALCGVSLLIPILMGAEAEPRQIASGLRDWYTEEQMLGQRLVVVCNLKPRSLMGFKSHGMVLCAMEGAPPLTHAVQPPPAGSSAPPARPAPCLQLTHAVGAKMGWWSSWCRPKVSTARFHSRGRVLCSLLLTPIAGGTNSRLLLVVQALRLGSV